MYMVNIDSDKCQGCGECCGVCPANLLSLEDEKAVMSGDPSDCLGCETCVASCPHDAVTVTEL